MSETSSSNTSFRAVALRWLAESVGAIRLQSAEHYQGLLERMVFPRMGDVEVAAMAEDDVRGVVEALKEEGYSESTVYMIPRLVRRVLRFAAAEGLCPTPAWNIGLGTPGKEREALILSVGQMERMLASLAENPVPRHLGLYLILSAGVSPGEVVELTWADVSFPCECIRVPVSGKKVRQVSLDERQRLLLKKMAGRPECCMASGTLKPVSLGAMRATLHALCHALRFQSMTLMDLRYSFAVRALEEGMGFAELAKVLGQDNSRNFRRFYRELVSEDTRARLEREQEDARKPRQSPEHINHPGPDGLQEIAALRRKVEAKKQALQAELDCLDGDLAIIRALRNADGVQGAAREGFYRFIEKILGDDRDGRTLVEYLRSNMRVAAMPSRMNGALTPQTIRARVTRAFAKLSARLDTFASTMA